jgi:hypothetical protein
MVNGIFNGFAQRGLASAVCAFAFVSGGAQAATLFSADFYETRGPINSGLINSAWTGNVLQAYVNFDSRCTDHLEVRDVAAVMVALGSFH